MTLVCERSYRQTLFPARDVEVPTCTVCSMAALAASMLRERGVAVWWGLLTTTSRLGVVLVKWTAYSEMACRAIAVSCHMEVGQLLVLYVLSIGTVSSRRYTCHKIPQVCLK